MTVARVCVVTGFVPIPGHPRTAHEYALLGDRLKRVVAPRWPWWWGMVQVADTWLWKAVQAHPRPVTHSVSDNPAKNTLAYHCVQHQKTAWLAEAARTMPADVYVWIDYGIFHQPGVTAEVIQSFLERAAGETGIAIPGAWGQPQHIDDRHPCWRFCGSTLVCHRRHAEALDAAVRKVALHALHASNHVAWEVNAWAAVEWMYTPSPGVPLRPHYLPIRWYKGDHNETQFTGYTP